jgi:hypothetical protein
LREILAGSPVANRDTTITPQILSRVSVKLGPSLCAVLYDKCNTEVSFVPKILCKKFTPREFQTL